MKEAITKPLKGQEKAKAKGKRKAVSRREGVPPRAKVLSDGTTVVGIDIGERHVNLCEIDSDDAVTETRLANTPKKLREQFEGKAKRRIVLEAGAHTRWIAELLGELGHQVLVVDPRRTKLISGSLYKDDRVDAQTLAMLGRDAPTLLKTIPVRPLESQVVLTLVRARAGPCRGVLGSSMRCVVFSSRMGIRRRRTAAALALRLTSERRWTRFSSGWSTPFSC